MSKTASINMRVENILLDQRLFYLNEEDFKTFEAALIAPIPDNTRLKALLMEPSPWEK
ncbi:DUF1778 domain-containing protein [Photorhabdus stackebrandtii]|uniref:DUF1778 domain-containing protein n=1 Tax=Photorhabdus stackebrandtii TaxID=1123042 RepID=A0A7X5QKL2_9GAMM|nr:DUF1778 domain-containing protein [Photorhabdus stackebrandtii]NHB96202.1 hypothetical protein [Photorhabdus stackebrandtii]